MYTGCQNTAFGYIKHCDDYCKCNVSGMKSFRNKYSTVKAHACVCVCDMCLCRVQCVFVLMCTCVFVFQCVHMWMCVTDAKTTAYGNIHTKQDDDYDPHKKRTYYIIMPSHAAHSHATHLGVSLVIPAARLGIGIGPGRSITDRHVYGR